MTDQANENPVRQVEHKLAGIGTQIIRLGKVIAYNRHKFYDPVSREMLPSFAECIDSIESVVGDLATQAKPTSVAQSSPSLEEAIILHFADKDITETIRSFSAESLDEERKYSLTQDHYIRNTQKRIAKLKGSLLFVADERYTQTYVCVSLLYKLSMFPLRSILLEFTGGTQEKRNDALYKPISGVRVARGISELAQLFHRFATVKWVPESIDILRSRADQSVLNEHGLRGIVSHIKQIIEDDILLYIIQHIGRSPFEEIPIKVFDDDLFEKYFAHIQKTVDFTDSKYEELQRKETIQKISINLFGHLPDVQLNIYTRKNRALLEKQDIHYFKHTDLVENIILFIDHVFQTLVIGNLQIPLLLKAVWNDPKAQRHMVQLFTDMKDLRVRISTIDQEIISLFGKEKLLHDVLNNCDFIETHQKKEAFDKFAIIDSRFAETIHIFRGIAKHMIIQMCSLSKDRTTAKKRMIRNWIEVGRVCAGIEHKLLKAISVLEDCVELIAAIYQHSENSTGAIRIQD